MLGIPARRRRLMAVFAFLLIAFVSGVVGCGGPSTTTSTGGKSTPATTTGTYVFTVNGTDAANAKRTSSTNITVTVQ